jgi:hypothetical protein
MSVLAIDDLLKLILQFGNFDDFIAFGQVCKLFNKCRSIDNVCVQLNSDGDSYHCWLKSRKWKIASMTLYHEEALKIVSGSLNVLHISKWNQPKIKYNCIPETLTELSLTFCFLPFSMDFTRFHNLVKLSLANSKNTYYITFPSRIKCLNLQDSDFYNMESITHLSQLQLLNISNCTNLFNLDHLEKLRNLRQFSMCGISKVTSFQLGLFLCCMKNLETVDLSHSHALDDSHLELMAEYKNLKSLNVSHSKNPLDLSIISGLSTLQELNGLQISR